MKKIVLSILLSSVFICSFAQQSESSVTLTGKEYLIKARHQKTAAWLFLAAGAGGLLGTALADASNQTADAFGVLFTFGTYEPEKKSYAAGYVISFVCMAASIPLFISASNNKQKAKAASVYFKMEKAPMPQSTGIVKTSYPSLAVKIPL